MGDEATNLMEIVCDCSVALAWGLPDEQSDQADQVLRSLTEEGAFWVPSLWWYELSNALTVSVRRNRIESSHVIALLELFGRLPVKTDSDLDADRVLRLHSLAIEHGLSCYDAAYLELSIRKSLPLATLDERLRGIAATLGLDWTRSGALD